MTTSKSPPKALVVNVQRFSLHDGPGIRTTVFFKGCPLRCAWCQNPESLRFEPEGIGQWMDVDELLEAVARDRPFYGSDGGVTLSGGEPTLQMDFLRAFVPRCVEEGLSVGLQTSGAYRHEALAPLLPHLDFIHFDLKLMDRAAHKEHTGSDNRRIHANARALVEAGVEVVFRMPVVPTINDTEANVAATAELLEDLGQRRIRLLEYHRLGEAKLEGLGFPIPALGVDLDAEAAPRMAAWFDAQGVVAG